MLATTGGRPAPQKRDFGADHRVRVPGGDPRATENGTPMRPYELAAIASGAKLTVIK